MSFQPYALWLIAGILLMLLELLVPGLVVIWFGIGALFAGFVAFLGVGSGVQIAVFLVVSILSLVFVRKFFASDEESQGVGAERLVGKECTVVEKISPGKYGKVKVEGELWLAESGDDCETGKKVKIVSIEGTHLIVKKID